MSTEPQGAAWHAAEAARYIGGAIASRETAALVHATMALASEQRTANLLAYARLIIASGERVGGNLEAEIEKRLNLTR